MMGAIDTLDRCMKSSRAVYSTAYDSAMITKAGTSLTEVMMPGMGGTLVNWQQEAKYRERYGLFSGWLYSSINVIASKGAEQPVRVGSKKKSELKGTKDANQKAIKLQMTGDARQKAADNELEIMDDHPIQRALADPNAIQGRWQFVYSFLSNLCLTGWGFIVTDTDDEGEIQFYSLPTTWVKPVHKDGPFSHFKIVDPNKPESGNEDDLLDRTKVGFAHLPNPADPRTAYAPAGSQMTAIRISDHIQTSRLMFFKNGIFPSVIVTVGKDPHPDVPGGIRPRLTSAQRRQVYNMIRKTMGSVANYGNPAIVDGMIESIEKLSMTNTEMGWEKSDESVKKSIFSAFGVHPFVLGEPMNVGGYAQATIIKELFYDRVNSYLNMLSNVMTNLVQNTEGNKELLVWWEKCEAVDPQMRDGMLRFARGNNDISQNEFRALLGYEPDEDRNESVLDKSNLTGIVTLLGKVAEGGVQNVQAIAILEGLGLPSDLAKEIAGPKVEKPETVSEAGQLSATGEPVPEKKPPIGEKPVEETEEEATKALLLAVEELRRTDYGSSKEIAQLVIGMVKNSYIEKFNPYHDSQGRFTSGPGGGGVQMAPDTGGGFGGGGSGGRESYNDRIEGTQKEADREVKRYVAKARKAEAKLKKAESEVGNTEKIKGLQKSLSENKAKQSVLNEKLTASRNRIAELKAKLDATKSTKEELLKELDSELDTMKSVVDQMSILNDELDLVLKELE